MLENQNHLKGVEKCVGKVARNALIMMQIVGVPQSGVMKTNAAAGDNGEKRSNPLFKPHNQLL